VDRAFAVQKRDARGPHRIEMRAAGNHGDVVPGCG